MRCKKLKNLLTKFKDILSTNNYKLTSQRKDILKVFIENQHRHFNAETLLNKVKEINKDIGLATIYRNLEIFCELGIAYELDLDSPYKYYELNVEGNHHHHMICMKCGKIIEFNDKALEDFENELENNYNFKIVNHQIKFYGICNNCLEDKD